MLRKIFKKNNDENLLLLTLKFVKQKEYWTKKLSGDIEKTEIPFDHYKKIEKPYLPQKTRNKIEFQVPGNLCSRLVNLSKGSNLSIYIILLAALKILASRYTSQEDIIIVSPIYKLNISEETINDRVFIRETVRGDMTCKELILNTRESVLQAYENQDYPFDKLTGFLLPTPDPANDSSFSDITCSLSSIHDPKNLEAVNTRLTFSFAQENHKLDGWILYDPDVYERFYLEQVLNHYINILDISIGDVNKKVRGISFLSEEEKQRLLFEFNDTTTGYPREKTIHELFEEQVERTPDHTALLGQIPNSKSQIPNAFSGMYLSYRELNEKSGQLAFFLLKERGVGPDSIVGILLEHSIEMIIGILSILKAGGAYLPIDPNDPEARINYMLAHSGVKILLASPGPQVKVKEESIVLIDISHLLSFSTSTLTSTCQVSPANLAYVIFTSGSTGKPKAVMVEHQGVVNYTCWAIKNYVGNEKVTFPLFTSLSFDLTVTSIFTPLLSGNSIIMYEGERKETLIEKLIEDNRVGVVKLTPSHLKLILEPVWQSFQSSGKKINSSIQQFIVGGENLDTQLAGRITQLFHKAVKIYNEYGPTEGTVGCMIYQFCPRTDTRSSVPIGRAVHNLHIYLLDKNKKPVPRGAVGELYISGDGAARGYLNRPELTGERFMRDPFIPGKRMYKTGDLGLWLPDGNIEFRGRIDQQVKIRGYRIELGEIESQLLKHEKVKEAVVLAREISGTTSGDKNKDKYLCAYIVSNGKPTTSELRKHLNRTLPDFMIPSYFMELENIPLTPNGKIDRRNLPAPGIPSTSEYTAPGDEIEKRLVEIWSQVLGIAQNMISIHANFFQLGGHSLKATILTSRIHKELNVKVALLEIFRTPTIEGLAQYIKKTNKDRFVSIKPVEKMEYYALSSAQKRLYIEQYMQKDNMSYNVSSLLKLERKIDKQRLEETLQKMIRRHETLRTSFKIIENKTIQQVYDNVEFKIDYYDLPIAGEEVQRLIGNFFRPFDLSRAPLLRVGLIKDTDEGYILITDQHHIITDGTSKKIFLQDFFSLFAGKELPPLQIQYKDFSEWQNSQKTMELLEKQEKYWLKEFEGDFQLLNLPTDFERPKIQQARGDRLVFQLDIQESHQLKKMAIREGITLYILLLAIINVLFSKECDQEETIIGAPIAGRRHADLEPLIGFFVNTLAMRNFPIATKTFHQFLMEVKERTIKAFENQDYQFEELVEKVLKTRKSGRSSLVDAVFVFQNTVLIQSDTPDQNLPHLPAKPYKSNFNKDVTPFDWVINGFEQEEILVFIFLYRVKLFKKETIEMIIRHFKEVVSAVLDNPNIQLKDINITNDLLSMKSTSLQEEEGDFGF
jgi:amino acid adenylation domain-containing protein